MGREVKRAQAVYSKNMNIKLHGSSALRRCRVMNVRSMNQVQSREWDRWGWIEEVHGTTFGIEGVVVCIALWN